MLRTSKVPFLCWAGLRNDFQKSFIVLLPRGTRLRAMAMRTGEQAGKLRPNSATTSAAPKQFSKASATGESADIGRQRSPSRLLTDGLTKFLSLKVMSTVRDGERW